MMTRKWFSLAMLVTLVAALMAGCAQPMPIAPPVESAAESGEAPSSESAAAGEAVRGGVFTRSTSSDASILNPILWSDNASSGVGGFFFPSLIAVDPQSGAYVTDGSMSESWEASEDGLTWTFKLRDGVTWSDGDPVDAADFKYTYDAVASDLVETPRKSNIEQIESIEVVDPLTLKVVFKEVKCDGFGDLGLGWLPSHLYAADFSDIMTSPLNEAPTVSAGPSLSRAGRATTTSSWCATKATGKAPRTWTA
jgi:peptide/nickel transport system substrate-binding protein